MTPSSAQLGMGRIAGVDDLGHRAGRAGDESRVQAERRGAPPRVRTDLLEVAVSSPSAWRDVARSPRVTGLQHHDGGPPIAKCAGCGVQAVGPCARCHAPVCGDCCVLSEGGSKTFAICLDCDARGGRSLSGGWLTVILWVGGPMLVLLAAVLLLAMLR
jgi:hypothetical protein